MPRIGVSAGSGTRVSHGRATTGSVAGGGSASVVVTIAPTMADTNYTASAAVQDAANDLRILAVTAKTTSSVTVAVSNSDAINAATGTVNVLAVHD